MNDFGTHLTALLDDAAASVDPRPDFDAVLAVRVDVVPGAPTPGGRRPFRRTIAIAAATAIVLSGVAAAAYQRSADDPDLVATSSSMNDHATTEVAPTTTSPVDASAVVEPADGGDGEHPAPTTTTPAAAYAAELGESSLGTEPIEQVVVGTASPGELVTATSTYGVATAVADELGRWRLDLRLVEVPPATEVAIRVTFERSPTSIELTIERPAAPETTAEPDTPAAPETKTPPETTPSTVATPTTTIAKREPPPEPVPFTAYLGGGEPSASPMTQILYGRATPGSVVLATSAYGWAKATAGPKGGWELVLKMHEVPAPSGVRITVSADTGGAEYEFWVERPAPPSDPKPVPFTAEVRGTKVDGELFKVLLVGTGKPGSAVRAASEFGVGEAVVSERGKWELALKLWEVTPGTVVGIRVTNNAADAVHEFEVRRPPSEPEPIAFTAQAALKESNRTPPVNEYWGTSVAGATITVSSPYGGTTVTANADGKWDARVEFPEAPVGKTFLVVVTSSKGEAVYEFPFTRTAPA